jgi:hypothetical protein
VKRGLFPLALICVLTASACGGDDGGGGASAGGTATEEATGSDRCENVPPGLVQGIATGLTVGGGGTLTNAKAVKSNDFERVYFISADIDGPGLEGPDDIGTWAKSGPLRVGGGLILSVDAVAKEFSDWGDGGSTDAMLSMDDDGAEESKECVEEAEQ